MHGVRMTQGKRLLLWLLLAALVALVTYYGFRGYLTPELMMNFSSNLTC